MNHPGTQRIETKRLILRRFTMDDLEPVYRNCWSDPEVWKWTNYAPMHSITDVSGAAGMFTERWLGAYDRPDRYSWAIQIKSTGKVIGRLFGMHSDDASGQIELTYELGRPWWNQGLMTEAVKAVIDFFFTQVGYRRIYAYHASENPASGKVMQKCGMTYEGISPHSCKCNYGIFDKVNYAIYADAYRPLSR